MDFVDAQRQQQQRGIAAADTYETGTVAGLPGGTPAPSGPFRVLVNVFGSVEDLPVTTDLVGRLRINDRVVILRGQLGSIVAGRIPTNSTSVGARPVPAVAEVVGWAVANQTVWVKDANNTQYGPYPYLRSWTATAGHRVAIVETAGGPVVLGQLSTDPSINTGGNPGGVAPPPTGGQSGTSTFPAVDARSFRNGSWRTDSGVVAQGDWGGFGQNTGGWFHGSGPGDALRGATITRTEVRIRRRSGGVWGPQDANLYRHTSATRPVGNVTVASGVVHGSVDIGETKWVEVPADWGQQIVNAGGGVMITGAPYVVLDGLDSDAESGALRLTWQR